MERDRQGRFSEGEGATSRGEGLLTLIRRGRDAVTTTCRGFLLRWHSTSAFSRIVVKVCFVNTVRHPVKTARPWDDLQGTWASALRQCLRQNESRNSVRVFHACPFNGDRRYRVCNQSKAYPGGLPFLRARNGRANWLLLALPINSHIQPLRALRRTAFPFRAGAYLWRMAACFALQFD